MIKRSVEVHWATRSAAFANREERECRAIDRALNFTHSKCLPTWDAYLEWLDLSIESAMRHALA